MILAGIIFMKIKSIYKIILIFTVGIFYSYDSIAQVNVFKLVKEVQKNCQRQYKNIHSLSFKAKSLRYLYFKMENYNIRLVPEYEEYYFDGYWIKADSLRIIVTALNRVINEHPLGIHDYNIPEEIQKIDESITLPNPFRFSYDIPSIDIQKRDDFKQRKNIDWPVYPFAEGADSLYSYEISGTMKALSSGSDEMNIITLMVMPKYEEIPSVIGTFKIDIDKKIVTSSNIIFNEAARIVNRSNVRSPLAGPYSPVKHHEHFKSKINHALFHSSFWFPQQIEEEYLIQMMGFNLKLYHVIDFFSYSVNNELPDTTILKNKKILYLRDKNLEKNLYKEYAGTGKLSAEEENRIITENENLFASEDIHSGIFNSDLIGREVLNLKNGYKSSRLFASASRFADFFAYNRVEGFKINYGLDLTNLMLKNSILSLDGGYGFSDKHFKGSASILYFLNERKSVFLEGSIYKNIEFNEDKTLFPILKNSFSSLFFNTDYHDYYYTSGQNIGLGVIASRNLSVKLSAVSQTEKNAIVNTKFSIFKPKTLFRFNPEIIEGKFKGIRSTFLYKRDCFSLKISGEITSENRFNSDFSYSLLNTKMVWNYNINPVSSLIFTFNGGTSSGTLPPQRWFDFGGKSLFNFYGNLRGVEYKAFTGDKMAFGMLEYSTYLVNFIDIPCKLNVLTIIKRLIKFNVWTGFGWSQLAEKNRLFAAGINTPGDVTDGTYYEYGIGIAGFYDMFRLDFLRNSISKNKVQISLNVFK